MARPTKILSFALCSALLVPAVQLVGGLQPLQAARSGNRSLSGVVGLAAPLGLGNGYPAPMEQLRGVGDRFLNGSGAGDPITRQEPVPLAVVPNPRFSRQLNLSNINRHGYLFPTAMESDDNHLVLSSLEPLSLAQSNSRQAEAIRLFNQAVELSNQGELQEAVVLWEQSLQIQREIRDLDLQWQTLVNLSLALNVLEQREEAILFLQEALTVIQEVVAQRGSSRELQIQEGMILGTLGIVYRESGQYEQAIAILERRIAIAQEIGDRAGEGAGWGNLGLAYTGLGEYEQAIAAYEQRLEITRELGQRDREALNLANLAEAYVGMGRISEAINLLNEALRIAQEIGDQVQVDRILDRIADLESLSLQPSAPEFSPIEVEGELTEESPRITLRSEHQEPVVEQDTPYQSHTFTGQAGQIITVHVQSDDFIPLLILSSLSPSAMVAISEPEHTLSDSTHLVVTLPSDGSYELYVGAHSEDGQGTYRLSIAASEEHDLLLSDATTLARSSREKFNLGDFQEAIRLQTLALNLYQNELVRAAFPEISRREEVYTLFAIGNSYFRLEDFQQAIDFYQQALTINPESVNLLHVEVEILDQLARIYHENNEWQQIRPILERQIQVYQSLNDRASQGRAIINLANATLNLQLYQEAMNLYNQVLSIASEIPSPSLEVTALQGLGLVNTQLGQYAQAAQLYEQSLVVARDLENYNQEALALVNLAALYETSSWDGRNIVRANEFISQLVDIANQQVDDLEIRAYAFSALGRAYLRGYGGRLENHPDYGTIFVFPHEEAWNAYQTTIQLHRQLENHRSEAIGLQQFADYLLRHIGSELARDLYLESQRIAREIGDLRLEADALFGVARAYSGLGEDAEAESSLLTSLAYFDILRGGNLSDADKVALFDIQADAYQFWQQLLISQGRTDEALVASERARARVLVETLLARTANLSGQEIDRVVPDLAEIRRFSQQQNTTLVSYQFSDGAEQIVNIWVVQPTGAITFRTFNLGPSSARSRSTLAEDGRTLVSSQQPFTGVSLTNLVTDTRDAIGVRGDRASARPTALDPEAEARRLAQQQAEQAAKLTQLHDLLIAPIADLLPTDPDQKVAFIPQGELFLVPFPALKDANGTYLIEKHTMLTAPSIQVLQLTQDIAERAGGGSSPRAERPLIVGDPTMPTVTFLSETGGFQDTQLAPLYGARREAEAVGAYLETPALLGDQATEARIKQQIANADLIHLATHGLLEYGDPRETGSRDIPGAIALAPGNGEDGLLTSAEILELNLQANLVVLSACDTGRGRLAEDGVIGLSRAFIAAGVPSIIVSLWAVPDAPTADLMTEFYRQLDQGQTKAQALRQAMLITMQSHPDPKDWAAFTLVGAAE